MNPILENLESKYHFIYIYFKLGRYLATRSDIAERSLIFKLGGILAHLVRQMRAKQLKRGDELSNQSKY